MLLDLRKIIEHPGAKISFDYEPDLSEAVGGSITQIKEHARAKGTVTNTAGMLIFSCELDAVCKCECARCLKEFEYPIKKTIKAGITESGTGENPDEYYLKDDKIDATEIITTEFILDTSDVMICNKDCAGLCHKCGANLNSEKCNCPKDIDPRLAILGQLLENKDDT